MKLALSPVNFHEIAKIIASLSLDIFLENINEIESPFL
jgi:hypothetical protein